ncbi:MAG TPA: SAM-dependent methyltransferase [Clostridiales bacterium]|nr:SAM-dependent methyltransferase [Clostridiales bacterium]
MTKIINLLENIFIEEKLILGIISNKRIKDDKEFNKISIKPVVINKENKFQFTYEYKNKVLHSNLDSKESIKEIMGLILNGFKQSDFYAEDGNYKILINKKGNATILKSKATKEKQLITHNRNKRYIINDGQKVDFLIRLGVMNKDGKVFSKKYDKFRQINRYLEMVEDIIPKIKKDRTINIVDFGCGKSYLTFALYYYLVHILKFDINIIGLDLKEDVIKLCNEVAIDLDYKGLKFIHSDIKDFNEIDKIDMVVTLHACDIATDAAIVKAVNWKADIILLVPCCQHEFYDKIDNVVLAPMLSHGIIKEKLSSLVTDSLRANILEILGYKVQVLEFIDMEHTPKNILIRATKSSNQNKKDAINKYKTFKEFWGLEKLYIEKELGDLFK